MTFKKTKAIIALTLAVGIVGILSYNVKAEDDGLLDEGIIDTQNGITGEPVLMPVSAYIESGKPTYTGCTKESGIIAARKEWLGMSAILYYITPENEIGEMIGIYPIEDIGYGKSIGYGCSDFDDRKYAGDIEVGMCIDMRCSSYQECVNFMTDTFIGAEYSRTGSAVYFQLIDGDG